MTTYVTVEQDSAISINVENPFMPANVEVASMGIQGAQGYSLLSGHGSPTAFLGTNKDLYLNLDNGYLYKKIDDEWEYQTYITPQQKKIVISAQNILDKYVTLSPPPSSPTNVTLEFLNGGGQENGVEFKVTGSTLSWAQDLLNGVSGMEGFIAESDIIIVRY